MVLLVLLVIVLGAGSIIAVGFTIGLIFTLIMAGLVGWAADLIVPGRLPGGWFGAVLSGLIGGLIGTWLFHALGIREPGFELFGIHLIRALSVRPGSKKLADVRDTVRLAMTEQLFHDVAVKQLALARIEFTGKAPFIKPGTTELVTPVAGK